jgi:hypothetical protein
MNLKQLKDTMPYQWRIQSWNKEKTSASCVAYIDARDVATMLDNVCGPENWQDDYRYVGTMLFGGIGIKIGDEWVWKWDTGSESNIEKEKGHSSDAFKRAGVKWGIGRFLYDLPIQRVKGNGQGRVQDESGKDVWDVTEYINNRTRKPQPKAAAPKAETKQPTPTVTQAAPPKTPTEKPMSDTQRKQIMAIYGNAPREARIADANAILLAVKPGMTPLTSFSELTERQAAYLVTQLEKLRAA